MRPARLQKDHMLLGLDVSTKTCGISLFYSDGKLAEITHISPVVKPKPESEEEEMILKCKLIAKKLEEYKNFSFDEVIIEEPLLKGPNVYTIAKLVRFNGMVSKEVFDLFGVIPKFISSYDARKFAFPELVQPNKKGKPVLFGGYPDTCDKKAIIWDLVANREPQIIWLYDKKNRLRKENFDATDSYTVVYGYMRKTGRWS